MKVEESISIAAEELYARGFEFKRALLSPRDYGKFIDELSSVTLSVQIPPGLNELVYHTPFGEVAVDKDSSVDLGGIIVLFEEGRKNLIASGSLGQSGCCLHAAEWLDSEVIIVASVKLLVTLMTLISTPPYLFWSDRVLQQLSKSAQRVLVFYDTNLSHQLPTEKLDQHINSLDISNIDVQTFRGPDRIESNFLWKKRIMRLGGIISHPTQLVSHPLELAPVTGGSHLTFIGENGSNKLGIFRESRSKFLELAKERERKAIW